MSHNDDLTEFHRLLVNPLQIQRWSTRCVVEPSQNELVPACDEERKHVSRPQCLELGLELFGQMESKNEARIYPKHVEFSLCKAVHIHCDEFPNLNSTGSNGHNSQASKSRTVSGLDGGKNLIAMEAYEGVLEIASQSTIRNQSGE